MLEALQRAAAALDEDDANFIDDSIVQNVCACALELQSMEITRDLLDSVWDVACKLWVSAVK